MLIRLSVDKLGLSVDNDVFDMYLEDRREVFTEIWGEKNLEQVYLAITIKICAPLGL